jgi:hypothetical protein
VLGVEMDVSEILGADRLKGSKTYVEGDGFDLDAALTELIKNFGSEVKTGGRSGGRSGFVRVHRLIAFAVFRAVVAMDIRRQRHVADLFEDGLKIGRRREAEGALAELSGGKNLGGEQRLGFVRSVEVKVLAGLDLAAGTDESRPVISSKRLGQQDFDASAGEGRALLRAQAGTGSVEAGRDDAAVVEDEEVAGTKDLGKIAEEIVAVFSRLPVEEEHAAGASNRRRRLGDQFFGEIEMEIGYTHRFYFSCARMGDGIALRYLPWTKAQE